VTAPGQTSSVVPASPATPPGRGRTWLRRRLTGFAAAAVVIAVLATWGSGFGQLAAVRIGVIVLMYAALASGWNILGGYAGYMNFGTALFFGVGAYATALASSGWHVNPLLTVPVAAVAAGLAGVFIGMASLRLRGGYFAIATFILTLAVQSLALVLGITHGALGLYITGLGISPVQATRLFFDLFLALAALAVLLCWLIEQTRWYSALTAIREDEDAAEVLGVPTSRYKMAGLVAGAVIAGIAGSFYAAQIFYIEPVGTFDFNISLATVVAVAIGGSGRWFGPLIGAVITQLLAQELFVHVQGAYSQLSYGALLIIVVLAAPAGLAGLASRLARRPKEEP
jgi:branched-chain amino acid transport system permease protein